MVYLLVLPIARDNDNAREQLAQRGEVEKGHLKLRVISSEAESVLSDVLSRFNAACPQ